MSHLYDYFVHWEQDLFDVHVDLQTSQLWELFVDVEWLGVQAPKGHHISFLQGKLTIDW